MNRCIYRFTFYALANLEDVESSALLAKLGAESLHGESQVDLELEFHIDRHHRQVIVDAGTVAGKTFNRLFAGFLRRELGPNDYLVERVVETNAFRGRRSNHLDNLN